MSENQGRSEVPARADVAIVGAGFSGMYLIKLFREAGINAVVLEQADGVGGTWYWNRYPGARCDIESVQYGHAYLPELQQEWNWSERYATQPELLAYANEIADRLDVRRDICFGRTVTKATYDEAAREWTLTCDTGESLTAPFYIMATGCLSVPNEVDFPGKDSFRGPTYHTGYWPHDGVDFTGQRVGVIGTGSSGIQSIPVIAKQARDLTIFQRTPNYAIPAHNRELDDAYRQAIKDNYEALRARQRQSFAAADFDVDMTAVGTELDDARRQEIMERRWAEGGLGFGASFIDQMFVRDVNEAVAEFVRGKIREKVNDPVTAELLCPRNTIGAKRLCVDVHYFETYNQDHVHLVDVSKNPISITETGIETGGKLHEVDAIVYATGFDAMTGAIMRVDIQGRDGKRLRDHWANGPRTYLGLAVAGFPNLFTVTGPQSPSVFTNMTQAIEQHCEWIAGCIRTLRQQGKAEIEAELPAEDAWVEHNAEVGAAHLRSSSASWYTGENIAGKPVGFMPYIGGFPQYTEKCNAVAANGYEGFQLG